MKKWLWLLLTMLVIVLDQASKYWALMALSPYEPHPLWPMVSLTLAYNTGAAFSFLSHTGNWHVWFFAMFSLVMTGILLVWMARTAATAWCQHMALSLILGGAVGNLIDRVSRGHVIDFIDVYYKNYHWPIFNIADSAICAGVILLFWDLYKNPRG